MCQICGGILMLLGKLGSIFHYNCRNCGMQCSSTQSLEFMNESCNDDNEPQGDCWQYEEE